MGDCLDVLPTIPDGSVDMVFADLPYAATSCHWDSAINLGRLWHELLRVGKQNAAFAFTATMRFAWSLIASQPKLYRYDLVWDRRRMTGFFTARKMPMRSHEHVLVFYRSAPTYNPQKRFVERDAGRCMQYTRNACYGTDQGKLVTTNWRHPTSILRVDEDRCAKAGKRRLHPTQKPVALLEWLIKTYSNPGDTVLDPTAGSGTTALAALRTGRKFVCIERDATYFATMQGRVTTELAGAEPTPVRKRRPAQRVERGEQMPLPVVS